MLMPMAIPVTMPAMTVAAPRTAGASMTAAASASRQRAPRLVVTAAASSSTRVGRLIESEGIISLPGVYDALSAAIVQKSGYSAGFISGYGVSASLLGKPDVGLLTPPEMAETAKRVVLAVPQIPFLVDADTGGGSAVNVQRTVQDLIAAGAAGCFLEDQAWPKKCGHMSGKQVIPAEEHAVKIAAAREVIGDRDFFLVARTDARAISLTTGLNDAIDRANLYMDAGADACFVEAPRDDDEFREIGRRTRGYRVANLIEGGKTPIRTPTQLKAMGFHLVVHSLTTVYAAARAVIDILKALKEDGSTDAHLHKLTGFAEFNTLIGLESWFELETRFAKLDTKEKETPIGVANGRV